MPNEAKKVSIKGLMKRLDDIATVKGDTARAEAIEKAGTVIVGALEEFHTHLNELDLKVTGLESNVQAVLVRQQEVMGRLEEQFKAAAGWIIKMLDAFPKEGAEGTIGFQATSAKKKK
jgi:hypothetical protein